MFHTLERFLNLIELFGSSIISSNFTLNTICFVCGFAILTSLKFFRSFFNNLNTTTITESVRNAANDKIKPRRITLLNFGETAQVDKVLGDLLKYVGAAITVVVVAHQMRK